MHLGGKQFPLAVEGGNNSWMPGSKKTYLTNDFIRPRENKETNAGKKHMTQMFYPDLSSESGHPVHLRDSAWPLVI